MELLYAVFTDPIVISIIPSIGLLCCYIVSVIKEEPVRVAPRRKVETPGYLRAA